MQVGGGVSFEMAIRVINPILTVWEGITGKYKPSDYVSALPAVGLILSSSGLYFPVMPSQTVSIGLILPAVTVLTRA